MFPVQFTYELNIPISWSLQAQLAGPIPSTDFPFVCFFFVLFFFQSNILFWTYLRIMAGRVLDRKVWFWLYLSRQPVCSLIQLNSTMPRCPHYGYLVYFWQNCQFFYTVCYKLRFCSTGYWGCNCCLAISTDCDLLLHRFFSQTTSHTVQYCYKPLPERL